MTPNAAGKTALEGKDRSGGEELAPWGGSERRGSPAAPRTGRRGRSRQDTLEDESTGAVLERELLLVQPPSPPRPSPGLGRLLRVVCLLAILLTSGAAATWGAIELRRSWQASIDGLQSRLDQLASENAAQAAVVLELRRENEKEVRARQAESRKLGELVQKTLVELETTDRRLEELRTEKDALEERYRELRTKTERGALERLLDGLVPRWLRERS